MPNRCAPTVQRVSLLTAGWARARAKDEHERDRHSRAILPIPDRPRPG